MSASTRWSLSPIDRLPQQRGLAWEMCIERFFAHTQFGREIVSSSHPEIHGARNAGPPRRRIRWRTVFSVRWHWLAWLCEVILSAYPMETHLVSSVSMSPARPSLFGLLEEDFPIRPTTFCSPDFARIGWNGPAVESNAPVPRHATANAFSSHEINPLPGADRRPARHRHSTRHGRHAVRRSAQPRDQPRGRPSTLPSSASTHNLHAHPELSFMEVKTAALVAGELRRLGFCGNGESRQAPAWSACSPTGRDRRCSSARTWTDCRSKKTRVCLTPARTS